MAKLTIVTALIPVLLFGCKTARLPTEKYSQFEYKRSVTYVDGTLKIELDNPLHCPLRIWINTADEGLKNKFQSLPITLQPVSDTTIIITGVNNFDNRLEFASRLGSTSKEIKNMEVDLPFPPNREYAIIQGNYSGFTHNTDWARYALDFDLKTKDTICSATDGYVVGVVNRYQFGGAGREWEPYANFITVYEPLSGLFFQYVHLVKNGSLVKTGDRITRGQPIGLSGNTGQTTTPHLHFSCMVPVSSEDGLKSVPIQFTGGKKGVELKRGDRVKK